MNLSGPRAIRAAGAGLATLIVTLVAILLSNSGTGSGAIPPNDSPVSSSPVVTPTTPAPQGSDSGYPTAAPGAPTSAGCGWRLPPCSGQPSSTTTASTLGPDTGSVSSSPPVPSNGPTIQGSISPSTHRNTIARGGRH